MLRLIALLANAATLWWLLRSLLKPAAASAPANAPRGMDRAEARQVLGVEAQATREEIQESYQRLMKRVHPDQGGSAYFAARLNQARDILLK